MESVCHREREWKEEEEETKGMDKWMAFVSCQGNRLPATYLSFSR
jgi:hypothetical protein